MIYEVGFSRSGRGNDLRMRYPVEVNDTVHFDPQRVSDSHGAHPAAAWATRKDRRSRSGNPDETRAFLALATVRGIGQKTLFALAGSGRAFADALDQGPTDDDPGAAPPARRWSAVRNHALSRGDELAGLLERLGVTLLFSDDPRFPPQLLKLERPPHWLFVQGSIDRLADPSLAIVGTRKPSADGLFLARYVGECLADWRLPTVSGLAAGIDQLAHEHSLRADVPTIAVLGTGILDEYPKGSALLRDRILAAGGSIVTEYLPQVSYSAENFVQRNRLQAALGRMLIPVEWNRRSGTAHTVRFATALGRPIACLRLPEWPEDRVMLEPGLGYPGGALFTLPRDQTAFDAFVRDAAGPPSTAPAGQLSLFGEP